MRKMLNEWFPTLFSLATASWLSLFSNPIKLKTVERRNYIEIMQSKIKLVFVFCFIFKGHNYEMVNFLKQT
jgi:hypothetical protein